MTPRQHLQRLRQSTESTTRNAISRRSVLTATATTAQRDHITKHATLHKDSAVANTVLRALITGTQGALVATGVSPIAAGATQGLTGEATSALDTQREQITTSITVDADAGLRVYLPQRIEY